MSPVVIVRKPTRRVSKVPPDILKIFGKPPLLRSEDPEIYFLSLEQFAEAIEPKNIIEWCCVKDLADLTWEIKRVRRFKALLIDNSVTMGLSNIAYNEERAANPPMLDHPMLEDFVLPSKRKAKQFKSDEEIETFMAKRGLDPEMQAALSFASEEILNACDKFLATADARRDRVLREIGQFREAHARQVRDTSSRRIVEEDVIDVEEFEPAKGPGPVPPGG